MLAILAGKMAMKTVLRTVSDKLLLGTCLPCVHNKTIKVRVPVLQLDKHLLMHFKVEPEFFAYDPKEICNTGDIVLVRKLDKMKRNFITHEVVEVAYPLGDVIDPVTGERCIGPDSRAFLEKEAELYGKVPSSFNFAEAPPRGWQKGKKDFSDKVGYKKYHVFNEDEEEFHDPYAY